MPELESELPTNELVPEVSKFIDDFSAAMQQKPAFVEELGRRASEFYFAGRLIDFSDPIEFTEGDNKFYVRYRLGAEAKPGRPQGRRFSYRREFSEEGFTIGSTIGM